MGHIYSQMSQILLIIFHFLNLSFVTIFYLDCLYTLPVPYRHNQLDLKSLVFRVTDRLLYSLLIFCSDTCIWISLNNLKERSLFPSVMFKI